MVDPRIFIVSSEIVSPGVEGLSLFLMVIFTARNAVFICGETDVMVPCTMVPFLSSMVTVSLAHFMRNLLQIRQFTWVSAAEAEAYLTSFILERGGYGMVVRWCA